MAWLVEGLIANWLADLGIAGKDRIFPPKATGLDKVFLAACERTDAELDSGLGDTLSTAVGSRRDRESFATLLRVAGRRDRPDPTRIVGDQCVLGLAVDEIHEAGIQQRVNRAAHVVVDGTQLLPSEQVASLRERGPHAAGRSVVGHEIPADVIEVQVRAQHLIDGGKAATDLVAEARQERRITRQRTRLHHPDTGVDHEDRITTAHDERVDGQQQIAAVIDVRRGPSPRTVDLDRRQVEYEMPGRHRRDRLFDSDDLDTADAPSKHFRCHLRMLRRRAAWLPETCEVLRRDPGGRTR